MFIWGHLKIKRYLLETYRIDQNGRFVMISNRDKFNFLKSVPKTIILRIFAFKTLGRQRRNYIKDEDFFNRGFCPYTIRPETSISFLHFFTACSQCVDLDLHRCACLSCLCCWLYFVFSGLCTLSWEKTKYNLYALIVLGFSGLCTLSWEGPSLTGSERDQSHSSKLSADHFSDK